MQLPLSWLALLWVLTAPSPLWREAKITWTSCMNGWKQWFSVAGLIHPVQECPL